MKNNDLLCKKIDQSLQYLYETDQKLKPVLDYLTTVIQTGIKDESLSIKDAFQMWLAIQEQYTNSILLQTKLKEILEYKEK